MNKGRHACEQIFNDGVYWAWHPTLPSSTLAAQLLLSSGASLRPPPDRADEFPPLTARAALLVCLLVRSPAYSTGETAPMNPPTAKCCRLQHRHHHYQDESLLLTTLLQLQKRRAGRDCPRTFELPESGSRYASHPPSAPRPDHFHVCRHRHGQENAKLLDREPAFAAGAARC